MSELLVIGPAVGKFRGIFPRGDRERGLISRLAFAEKAKCFELFESGLRNIRPLMHVPCHVLRSQSNRPAWHSWRFGMIVVQNTPNCFICSYRPRTEMGVGQRSAAMRGKVVGRRRCPFSRSQQLGTRPSIGLPESIGFSILKGARRAGSGDGSFKLWTTGSNSIPRSTAGVGCRGRLVE